MFNKETFDALTCAWLGVGLLTFILLLFVPAPYGRHGRRGWGPMLSPRAGWLLMELPAVICPAAFFFLGSRESGAVTNIFLLAWMAHYLQRTFVFPILLRAGASGMPLSIPVLGFIFNIFNGCLQGAWLFAVGPGYEKSWLSDPRFLVGAFLFVAGLTVNWHSDAVLRRLRAPGETGYKVPQGGLFYWVSCPNYLGEIVEWAGWAVATWSLPGLVFAFWTAANLAPRALAHHRWYRERFPDYPKERRAIVPFVM